MDYLLHIMVMVSIFAILATSLDLVAGHTGLMSVAHAAFAGIGAYVFALITLHFRVPFGVGIAAAGLVAAMASLAVSIPSSRVQGDYFVITTFAFQLVMSSVFTNWTAVTRGPLGITGIPGTTLIGKSLQSPAHFLPLALFISVICCAIVWRLTASPFGRVLQAIREDEGFAQAMGKNTTQFKVIGLAVSSCLAGVSGGLYAQYTTYIDPTSFGLSDSILILSMVIIGGAGSRWGPLFGALLLVVFPEVLRSVGVPGWVAANIRQISYGTALVVLMVIRPRGVFGRYECGR